MSHASEHGAVIVEIALAVPLLVFMIFGLIEFGYAEYLESQASSAARDGARVGVLDPTDEDAIESAVREKVVGLDPAIAVTCFDGLSGESSSDEIDCDDAEANADRVRVTIVDTRSPITPAGSLLGTKDLRASATMVITGLPVGFTTPATTTTTTSTTSTTVVSGSTTTTTTTTSTTSTTAPPGGCVISSVLPAHTISFGNGANAARYTDRHDGTTIRVRASTDNCTSLRIRFPNTTAPAGYTEVPLTPSGMPREFTAPLGWRAYTAPTGTSSIVVVSSSGTALNSDLTITRN